jgi:uncharacterized membrane protein
VPDHQDADARSRALERALTGTHGREYLAFLLAFVLVGASWIAHHQLFAHVAGIDDRLMVLNLVALFGFVLVPWASETLGTAGGVGLAVYRPLRRLTAPVPSQRHNRTPRQEP